MDQQQKETTSLDDQVENDYAFETDPSNFTYPEFEADEPTTTQETPATEDQEETSEEETADDSYMEGDSPPRKDPNDRPVKYERFKEVYGKMKRAENDAQYYKQQVEQLHKQVQQFQQSPQFQQEQTQTSGQPQQFQQPQQYQYPQQQTPQVPALEEPKLENYQDYDSYSRDVASYMARKAVDEAMQTILPQQQQADPQLQAAMQRSAQMVNDQLRVDKNFATNAYIPQGLDQYVAGSDKFIELAYYFGKNKEYSQRLCHLPPQQIVREIGRLEGKLPSINGKRPRITSQAPRGVTSPTTSSGAPISKKDPSKMTSDEYRAWRASGGGE